jgi:hypothetical protein
MPTFFSRRKNLILTKPDNTQIDFSGGIEPPGEGKGEYTTSDAYLISWLAAHPGYGIDFATEPFTDTEDPPKIYTDEEKLRLLLDCIVMV